jgi:6-phosphogluconolactonase
MAKKLSIKYYVEPDPAALARRAAQYFVEMAGEAVQAAWPGPHRHQRRVDSQSYLSALLADPAQPWRNRMPWEKLDLFWVDERASRPIMPTATTA